MTTTLNPFDLLGEDDSDDISKLVDAAKQKAEATAVTDKKEEVPSKNQPGKDAKNESHGGGGRGGGGRGQGRRGGHGQGGRGSDRGFLDDGNSNSSYNGYSRGFDGAERQDGGRVNERRGGYSGGFDGAERQDGGKVSERRGGYSGGFDGAERQDGGKVNERRGGRGGGYGGNRGGRRGDFSNGDVDYDNERPARRVFERHSGSHSGAGRGSDVKRDGTGRGNWGTTEDDIVVEAKELVDELDKPLVTEKISEETVQVDKQDAHATESFENKELSDEQKQWIADKQAERLAEEKQKTLDEYEKEREEKRKALASLTVKSEERKVDVEAFNSMKLLSNKKKDEEVFVKLGADKDKRKEVVVDKAKRSVKTNEFLKLAEGVNSYRSSGGRGGGGRGRGGGRGSNNVEGASSFGVRRSPAAPAPSIASNSEFPTLGGGERRTEEVAK